MFPSNSNPERDLGLGWIGLDWTEPKQRTWCTRRPGILTEIWQNDNGCMPYHGTLLLAITIEWSAACIFLPFILMVLSPEPSKQIAMCALFWLSPIFAVQ